MLSGAANSWAMSAGLAASRSVAVVISSPRQLVHLLYQGSHTADSVGWHLPPCVINTASWAAQPSGACPPVHLLAASWDGPFNTSSAACSGGKSPEAIVEALGSISIQSLAGHAGKFIFHLLASVSSFVRWDWGGWPLCPTCHKEVCTVGRLQLVDLYS